MNKVDHNFIAECDELIKIGQGKQVLELVQSIPIKSIPRKYLSQVGTLLNRSGGSSYCLKILHSYIRGSYYDLGTDNEKKVYAKALIEIGAQNEGLDLINEIQAEDDYSLLLTKAFCYFKSWDYEKALPVMLKYINIVDDDYMKVVGKINLSSIYIFLKKYNLALNILNDLQKNLESKHQLLHGYILEQMGQVHFQTEKYNLSEQTLSQSVKLLQSSNQKALLYPQKWLALLELKTQGKTSLLSQIRNKNKEFNDFETLRDLDYWQGTLSKDKQLLSKVYYSTPFKNFQERIETNHIKSDWNWGKAECKPLLSIFGVNLPVTNELTSQLFCHLISDGYKPMTLGSIHSKLFPDEFYNPDTSPDRIYQVISRLNKKLNETFDYKIEKNKSLYHIVPENIKGFNYSIKKEDTCLLSQPKNILYTQLKNLFQNSNFTAKEVALKFNITQRTANRWILELSNKSSVTKVGKGRFTKYKVA